MLRWGIVAALWTATVLLFSSEEFAQMLLADHPSEVFFLRLMICVCAMSSTLFVIFTQPEPQLEEEAAKELAKILARSRNKLIRRR